MKHSLNGSWELWFYHPEDGRRVEIVTEVPGNVEESLVKEGFLEELMPPDRIDVPDKFSLTEWHYSRRFDAPPCPEGRERYLVLEGIDTVATVKVNSLTVLECANMHREYRIPMEHLKPAGNLLEVTIHSAELYARHREGDAFSIQTAGTLFESNLHLRKARYAWGWDHAPRLMPSGIFRDVYLEDLPAERFTEAYLITKRLTATDAKLACRWSYTLPDSVLMAGYTLHYTLSCEGRVVYEDEEAVFFPRGVITMTVPLSEIKLWWPRGYGEPNLCDFRMEMRRKGQRVAEWSSPWGIRTLRLFQSESVTEDGEGEFRFVINGEEIFARGTNWKPLDPLPSRAGAKLERALALLTDLDCNMVRVWGGGYYEERAFYDFCDRHGILVWQDFMFACEVPSRDPAYEEEVAGEARQIVKRLRNHPSLALWCSDNENDQNFLWSNGDGNALPSDQRISREVLRSAVIENDPFRPYLAGSPHYSDRAIEEYRRGGVLPDSPEKHLYTADCFEGGSSLRKLGSFFLGEVGPWGAMAMSLHEDLFRREEARVRRLWDEAKPPRMHLTAMHQHDTYFMEWRQAAKAVVKQWFGREYSVEEWKEFGLCQNIACAWVFKDTIEFWRSRRPEKTGVLWWSLLDMWPMLFNYSVVDSSFRPKLPYAWIKEAQQRFALLVSRRTPEGEPILYAANDTLSRRQGSWRILAVGEDGAKRELARGSYDAAPNATTCLGPLKEEGRELWLLEWEENGERFTNHFLAARPPFDLCIFQEWLKEIERF